MWCCESSFHVSEQCPWPYASGICGHRFLRLGVQGLLHVRSLLPSAKNSNQINHSDNVNARFLPTMAPGNPPAPPECAIICESTGFKYAGMEFGHECCELFLRVPLASHNLFSGCGPEGILDPSFLVPDSECSMTCDDVHILFCGAPNRLSVYQWAGFRDVPLVDCEITTTFDDIHVRNTTTTVHDNLVFVRPTFDHVESDGTTISLLSVGYFRPSNGSCHSCLPFPCRPAPSTVSMI